MPRCRDGELSVSTRQANRMIALGVQRARAIPGLSDASPIRASRGAYLLVCVGLPCPRFAPEHSCRQLAAGYKADRTNVEADWNLHRCGGTERRYGAGDEEWQLCRCM